MPYFNQCGVDGLIVKSGQVEWPLSMISKPRNWHPMYFPPYWPDLNPIERIWLTIKARWFNNHVCKAEDENAHTHFLDVSGPLLYCFSSGVDSQIEACFTIHKEFCPF